MTVLKYHVQKLMHVAINVDSREFSDTVTANILQQVREIAGQEMDVVVQPMPPMTP